MPGRVVVTGAGGFIGSAVVTGLEAAGCDVIALARRDVDLTDRDAVAAAIGRARPDVCLHLAAAGVTSHRNDLDLLVASNVLASLAVVAACARSGCGRVILAGSNAEVDRLHGLPRQPYGASKLAGVALAGAAAAAAGVAATHLRLFHVYGPGEPAGRLVPSVARALVRSEAIDLTAGTQCVDPVHVADVARAFVRAALIATPYVGTLEIGSGQSSSIREICLALADAAGADRSLLRFGVLDQRPADAHPTVADPSLAAAVLGWRPAVTLADGLREQVLAARAATEREVAA